MTPPSFGAVAVARLLTVLSFVGCVAMIVLAVWASQQSQRRLAQVEPLAALQQRAADLSVAADALLIDTVDRASLDTFLSDLDLVRSELSGLQSVSPAARGAVAALDEMAALAADAFDDPRYVPLAPFGPTRGVLSVPAPAAVTMTRMAELGETVEIAVAEMLRARRLEAEATVVGVARALGSSAVLVALTSLVAAWFLYRRLGRPAAQLVGVVHRVGRGDTAARADVRGRDEMAQLGAALNVMLDRRAAVEHELHDRQEALDEQRRVMEIAGRIARFGGWYVDTRTRTLTWSDRVFEIHEVPPGTRPSVDEAFAFYAPEHRARIGAVFERAVRDGVTYDEELQIVTATGRRVWVRTTGEPVRDASGRITGVQGAFQDIDDRKRAELRVHHLDQRLRTTLERLTDGFVLIDGAWTVMFANTAAIRIAGLGSDTNVAGNVIEDVLPGVMTTRIGSEVRRGMEDGVSIRIEDVDATTGRWLEVWADPTPEGLAVGLRDVTGRREMVERLRRKEAELAGELATRKALIDSLPANIAVLDECGVITSVNDRWRAYAGDASVGDQVGVSYLEVCDAAEGDDAAAGAHVAAGLRAVLAGRRTSFVYEYPCHSPREESWFRLAATPLRSDADPAGAVVMHVDISEGKRAEAALERIAFEDPLTGYRSRDGLARDLEAYLEQRPWPERGVLVTLDLVEVRSVNEAQGFAVGDALLAAVGDRLAAAAGPDGVVARTGGDAFAVFLPDPTPGASLSVELFGSPDGSFAQPFAIGELELDVAAHYGYTRLGAERRPVDALLREAEVALHASRYGSAANGQVYTSDLDREARGRLQLAHELREALRNDEFELHYQPKVDLEGGRLVAGETLIRWNHPQRGLLSPGAFIPVAEKSRLIVPIGRWVLDRACRTLRTWQDDGLDIVQISVNVSVEQLADRAFVTQVEEILTRYGVPPSSLTLEITESVFAGESVLLHERLDAVHALGVKLSLDDFGTGYSSLAYLKNYPFDDIKIDRAFVQGLPNDAYSRDIVASVLKIASSTGADVIAEGIELPEQRDALLALGCRLGQGYHYSVPLSEEDFAWLLAKRVPLPLEAA